MHVGRAAQILGPPLGTELPPTPAALRFAAATACVDVLWPRPCATVPTTAHVSAGLIDAKLLRAFRPRWPSITSGYDRPICACTQHERVAHRLPVLVQVEIDRRLVAELKRS